MTDEVKRKPEELEKARIADLPNAPGSAIALESWTDRDKTRTPAAEGAKPPEPGKSLTLDNAFRQFRDTLFDRHDSGSPVFIKPDKAAVCKVPKDQAGAFTQHLSSDLRPEKGKQPEVTLKELPNGKLERVAVSKNSDGSTLTIKTKEEYVRDAKGAIKKDEAGHDMTRVMTEDKEARNAQGQTTFKGHTDNVYDKQGNLRTSHTDLKTVDPRTHKESKYNSFDVKNEYKDGHLVEHKSTVRDAKGKAAESADAKYGYDEHGNLTTEDVQRVTGNKKVSVEHRENQYKQFGDKWELTATKADLRDKNGNPDGHVETRYTLDAKGNRIGESTTQKDAKDREVHKFDATYDHDGSRLWAKDTHRSWHANGTEKEVTTSEYNAIGPSFANRVTKDENGKVLSEKGIAQHDDGSITDAKDFKKVLLDANAGFALSSYEDNKESAWAQLERLSGDATNRDVVAGWDQLGKFAGGDGKQAAAVAKLEKWGAGDAAAGIDILESSWGNGEGRAAQGMNTYLSLGEGAAMKKAQDKGAEGATSAVAAVTALMTGGDKVAALKNVADSVEKFSDAVKALKSGSDEAERLREKVHKAPDVSGDLISGRGNGDCENGVCELKKDGDGDKPFKLGAPDPLEAGVDANLKWSPTGADFGEALRIRADIAGGDMTILGQLTEQMGTTEKLIDGQVVVTSSRLEGNGTMLKLGRTPSDVPGAPDIIDPRQAAENFKRAGVTPFGYEPLIASRNFLDGGVTTAMTTDAQGHRVPVLDANGKPVYLHSADKGVEAVVTMGGGNPVSGMDAMTELSTRRDAKGGVVSVDLRVGFGELPKIGETLTVGEGGRIVAVRDSVVSAETVVKYGAPALDRQGNPVPVLDANGKPIPPGVVGAQAVVELTRTKDGTDPAQISSALQAATGNERRIFERAVEGGKLEPGATFSPAESTRESLQFIGRAEGQRSGSALEGARTLTREQTSADGRSFTISPDGTAIGGLNAIRSADSAPADRRTVMGGAQEVSLMAAREAGQPVGRVERDELGFPKPPQAGPSQTFIEGARQTASLGDRVDAATGRPIEPTQVFSSGVSNVQSYAKDGTFSSGRETISFIGGGSDNPQAVPQGIKEIRTAADTTTAGSVSQLAAVTAAAGNGDPRVGAESMMTYRGRDGATSTSYSEGARTLYTDLYGAPSNPQNKGVTLQPRDVEQAVAIATPGTAPEARLQSGMDKTNEIVRSSGNPNLTGASVLTNLSRDERVLEAVRTAPTPAAAREIVMADPAVYKAITTPVPPLANPMVANALPKEAVSNNGQPTELPKQPVLKEVTGPTVLTGDRPVNVTSAVVFQGATVSGASLPSSSPDRRDVVVPSSFFPKGNGSESVRARESNIASIGGLPGSTDTRAGSGTRLSNPGSDGQRGVLAARGERNAEGVVDGRGLRLASGNRTDAATLTNATRLLSPVDTQAQLKASLKLADGSSLAALLASARVLPPSSAQYMRTAGGAFPVTAHETARTFSGAITPGNMLSISRSSNAASAAAEASQRAVAQNAVHVNLAAVPVMLKSGAPSVGQSGDASTRLTPRIGDFNTVRTSTAGGVFSSDGRFVSFRSSGSSDSSSSSNSRSVDLFISRAIRYGGSGDVDSKVGDLKIAKSKLKKFRRLGEDDLALFGAEIAFAALLVGAAIAREKDGDLHKIGTYQILVRPSWLVRPGENLCRLAEHLFHEAEVGWLIADLNIANLKETYLDGKRIVELVARQRIDLPVWQDIVEFHKTRGKNATPENLVTVVAENEVDTELMNSTLGVAMGAASPARPAPTPRHGLTAGGADGTRTAAAFGQRAAGAFGKQAAATLGQRTAESAGRQKDNGGLAGAEPAFAKQGLEVAAIARPLFNAVAITKQFFSSPVAPKETAASIDAANRSALVLEGLQASEGRRPLLAQAKRAALAIRRAVNARANDDQGPTAGAEATAF